MPPRGHPAPIGGVPTDDQVIPSAVARYLSARGLSADRTPPSIALWRIRDGLLMRGIEDCEPSNIPKEESCLI